VTAPVSPSTTSTTGTTTTTTTTTAPVTASASTTAPIMAAVAAPVTTAPPVAPTPDAKKTTTTPDTPATTATAQTVAPVLTGAPAKPATASTGSTTTTTGATATATVGTAATPATTAGTSTSTGEKSDTANGQAAPDPATTPAPAPAPAPTVADPTSTILPGAEATPISAVAMQQSTAPVVAAPVTPITAQALTFDRERFTQLVDGLEARLRVSGAEGGKAMRMTLRPAELGDVTVRLQIAADGQSATATLLAQHHQTGDMLAQAAGDLKQALADRGLRLDRLDVSAGTLGGDARPDGTPSGAPDPKDQQSRRTHYSLDMRDEHAADGSPEPSTAGTTTTPSGGLYVLA
jgi:flagellar hook-length control protein FliK